MSQASEIVHAFVDAINRQDDTALKALLHEDFVDHNAGPDQSGGPDAFASVKVRQLRSSFPDLQLVVEDILETRDRVAFRWRLTGTNEGAFAGQPATGKPVDFEGINIERIEDGRIAEHWSIHDALSLFHQLDRLG